ncbi:MAG: COG3400 family protein [Wolinella sp.]
MKKILLVLEGRFGRDFIETIAQKYADRNQYVIVAPSRESLPQNIPESFEAHYFDPTSSIKLEAVLNREISDALIVMDKPREREAVHESIRAFSPRIRLSILDGVKDPEDRNLECPSLATMVTNRLVERLPNVPVLARNIGLGEGEIMQANVPFGSSFAYRTLGSIQQKTWKIVALYRGGKLHLARQTLVIQPNDSLLVVGDPSVLRDVYHRIKEDIGQFPAPFGNSIFLYCDMDFEEDGEIKRMIGEALFLQSKLKNRKLHIRILNPRNPRILEELKGLDSPRVNVYIEYHIKKFSEILARDMKQYGRIGLLLLSHELFLRTQHPRLLYEAGIPVMKLGDANFKEISESVVILSDKIGESEKISSVVFDLSSQVGNDLLLYDFEPDSSFRSEIVEHYDNIARIFQKKIEVLTSSTQNPLRWLKSRKSALQILPYNQSVVRMPIFWFLSTEVERLSTRIKRHHQLLVPVLL